VAEYKGAHIATSDETKAKKAVGLLWEKASKGKGLFIQVEKEVSGQQPREQLINKIS